MGILSGRETIALKGGDEEVELNVSTNIDYDYPAEVTKHPIEREDGFKQTIADHVLLGERAINLNFVLSSSTEIFTLKRMTVDAKMKQLVAWQSKGQLLTLLGYSTNGVLAKVLSFLPSIFQYVEPDDEMERYIGRSIDEIPNLLLGPINLSESAETGDDVSGTLSLYPSLIVEAKSREITRVPSKGKATKKKDEKNTEPSPAKKSSWAKSLF